MIVTADVLEWCKSYRGEKFHSLLTDCPYHLSDPRDMRRGYPARDGASGEWDDAGRVRMQGGRGFMNSKWDGGGISFRSETWAALAEHLHPGAFGMAFASTRGYHRLAAAIEDAGLIIHPMLVWVFGSGFPKATRIDSAVDKAAGAVRPDKLQGGHMGYGRGAGDVSNAGEFGTTVPHVIGKGNRTNGTPATPLAAAWEGHRYGLQAIKPLLEPIVIFQKPYQGRPVDSITRTGAGALNIAGGRIGIKAGDDIYSKNPHTAHIPKSSAFINSSEIHVYDVPSGRWPSNLLLIHSPDCAAACVEGCPIRVLGEQSGVLKSGYMEGTYDGKSRGIYGDYGDKHCAGTYADEGTAARYFFNADYVYERLEAAAPFYYQAKSSTSEREAGLGEWAQTTVDDGRQTPIDNPYLRGETQRRNTHPCCKPIKLIKHLADLLLPPVEYAPRRLLIPFSGVGSEYVAAALSGFEEIVGIEIDPSYCDIARARIAWWRTAARRLMTTEPEVILAMQEQAAQATLFDEVPL